MADEPPLLDRSLRDLLELATSARSGREFRREALAWLDRHVGYDSAMLGPARAVGAEGPEIVGFDPVFLARFAEGGARYTPTLGRLLAASLQTSGAVRDVDVIASSSERARTPFYAELIGPKGSRVMLLGALVVANAPRGSVQISRAGDGARFTDREVALLRAAQPILSLGDGLHTPVAPPAPTRAIDPPSLTRRERDVLDYVALGLTNAEIALACGTSVNTVRNQVASLLRKVGAASRTELVVLAIDSGLVTPRLG